MNRYDYRQSRDPHPALSLGYLTPTSPTPGWQLGVGQSIFICGAEPEARGGKSVQMWRGARGRRQERIAQFLESRQTQKLGLGLRPRSKEDELHNEP